MPSVLFAIPIKSERYSEYEIFVKTITGAKRSDYQDMLRRYGLKNAKVWHHTFGNRQYLFTMHDITPEAQELLKGFTVSTHPFDKWFHDECLKVWDVPGFSQLPPQPTFVYEIET